MSSPQLRYAEIVEAVQQAPDLADVGRVATTVGLDRDTTIGPWFRQVVQGRYGEFTRPGLPDGPHYQRPYLLP